MAVRGCGLILTIPFVFRWDALGLAGTIFKLDWKSSVTSWRATSPGPPVCRLSGAAECAAGLLCSD